MGSGPCKSSQCWNDSTRGILLSATHVAWSMQFFQRLGRAIFQSPQYTQAVASKFAGYTSKLCRTSFDAGLWSSKPPYYTRIAKELQRHGRLNAGAASCVDFVVLD